jgi:hypothetical protein
MERFSRSRFNLLGHVRSVDGTYSYFDGTPSETRTEPADYALFDREGRLLEDRSGEREILDGIYKDIYKYDADANLIEREEYDRQNVLTGKSFFETNTEGHLVENHYYISRESNLVLGSKTFYGPDDTIRVVHFDTNGEPLKSASISSPAQTTETIRTPTDTGYMDDERQYNDKGELTFRKVTNYDRLGNDLDFSVYEPNGDMSIREEYVYEFDSEGNWTEQFVTRWVVGWGEYRLIPSMVTRRKIDYFK